MARSGWVSWVLAGWCAVALATSCSGAKDTGPVSQAGASAEGANDSPRRTKPLKSKMANGLPWLGMSCNVAADCGDQGLRCLRGNEDHADGQGAPSGGLCTTDCKTDADCRGLDEAAVCATLAEAPLVQPYVSKTVPRVCMQGCSLGAPSGATKCHGRSDLACRPFTTDHPATCATKADVCPAGTLCFRDICRGTACGPRCNANADCGTGRRCNPFTGLCDTEPPTPVPLGAACADDGQTGAGCGGGNCLKVDDVDGNPVKRMCTQSCTIGQICGEGQGACVWARFKNFAVGDAGYCVQRCDCDSDCANPADHCVAWGDPETERVYGSRGSCDVAPSGTPTLTCDASQVDAGGSGGAGSAAGDAAGGGAGAAN